MSAILIGSQIREYCTWIFSFRHFCTHTNNWCGNFMNERDLGKCRLRTGRRMTSALVSLGSRAICVRSCSPCRHVNWVASFCGEEVDVWWAGESAAVYLAAHLLVCWVSATANCCGGAVFTHCQRFPNTLCLWLLQSDLNVFERVCVCVCV